MEKSPEKLLPSKVVIVTGAANGIGRGIAIGMAQEGASVVIADIDGAGSGKTEKLIRDLKGNALIVPTDVRDNKSNENLVDLVLKEFGNVDILVNNAGINAEGGLLEIEEENALDVLNTNFIGPFFLTQRVAKEMIEGGAKGSILFTSSVHSQITQLHPAYTSSKAAVEMFVRDTALELAEYGIRVNAVAPGAIKIRGEKNRTNKHVPLGYSGTPQDIANAMIFLASEKGGYITGQTLVVDGGFSLAHTWHWIKKGRL